MRWPGACGGSEGGGAPIDRSLFGFVLRLLVLLGLDGDRLVVGVGFVEHLVGGGRLFLRLFGLFGLDLFVGVPAVAEERPAHVRPLLCLRGTVVAWERDPARVHGALEHLANRDARALRIGAHDRSAVLIPRAEEVDEGPPDLPLEEAQELAAARVDGGGAFPPAELALDARAVRR